MHDSILDLLLSRQWEMVSLICNVAFALAILAVIPNIESFEIGWNNGGAFKGRTVAPHHQAWFGGGGGDPDDAKDGQSTSALGMPLRGVSETIMGVENFKASQRIGKTTETLLQDLSSTMIEGSSSNGRVKVTIDGRQQPISASMDEAFFKEASSSSAITTAFVEAMKDAHAKSRDTMNDKMKGFYNELGL